MRPILGRISTNLPGNIKFTVTKNNHRQRLLHSLFELSVDLSYGLETYIMAVIIYDKFHAVGEQSFDSLLVGVCALFLAAENTQNSKVEETFIQSKFSFSYCEVLQMKEKILDFFGHKISFVSPKCYLKSSLLTQNEYLNKKLANLNTSLDFKVKNQKNKINSKNGFSTNNSKNEIKRDENRDENELNEIKNVLKIDKNELKIELKRDEKNDKNTYKNELKHEINFDKNNYKNELKIDENNNSKNEIKNHKNNSKNNSKNVINELKIDKMDFKKDINNSKNELNFEFSSSKNQFFGSHSSLPQNFNSEILSSFLISNSNEIKLLFEEDSKLFKENIKKRSFKFHSSSEIDCENIKRKLLRCGNQIKHKTTNKSKIMKSTNSNLISNENLFLTKLDEAQSILCTKILENQNLCALIQNSEQESLFNHEKVIKKLFMSDENFQNENNSFKEFNKILDLFTKANVKHLKIKSDYNFEHKNITENFLYSTFSISPERISNFNNQNNSTNLKIVTKDNKSYFLKKIPLNKLNNPSNLYKIISNLRKNNIFEIFENKKISHNSKKNKKSVKLNSNLNIKNESIKFEQNPIFLIFLICVAYTMEKKETNMFYVYTQAKNIFLGLNKESDLSKMKLYIDKIPAIKKLLGV